MKEVFRLFAVPAVAGGGASARLSDSVIRLEDLPLVRLIWFVVVVGFNSLFFGWGGVAFCAARVRRQKTRRTTKEKEDVVGDDDGDDDSKEEGQGEG